LAQNAGNVDPTQSRDWAPGAIGHAQQMRSHKDADQGAQPTPQVIPQLDVDDDPSGRIATFQRLATFTANNARSSRTSAPMDALDLSSAAEWLDHQRSRIGGIRRPAIPVEVPTSKPPVTTGSPTAMHL